MSAAIFLSPRGNGGGWHIDVCTTGDTVPEGHAILAVWGADGVESAAVLGEGDWEQLQHCIERLRHQKGWDA